jgi:FMN phosphatase YigB (HAD superfamily)
MTTKAQPPAVVAFDLGKVLLDFDYSIGARKLATQSDLPATEFQRQLDQSPLLHTYESGGITRAQFFDHIRSITGYRGSLAEFSASFADIFSEIPEMIALHAAVRERGVPVFIFSNTNDLAIEHVRSRFPFFAGFTGYIFSHEVGAMKPAPKIYEALEAVCGQRGDRILYVDDRAENIAVAAARGWRTVLHTDPARSRAAFAATGLIG